MSAVVVLTPVVVAAWPVLSAAIVSACASAGFAVRKEGRKEARRASGRKVELDVENAEVVAESLAHDDRIVVEREGVRVTFSRDARGRFKTCVEGDLAEDALRAIGEDLSGRVVQQYVYRRMAEELRRNGFVTLSEEKGPDETIRLRVRRHEG